MFYRRKIILALLQAFNNELDKIPLQKLLFLFTIRQPKPYYDFVPYLYGCYSFSAAADLAAMVRNGNIKENSIGYSVNSKTNHISKLNANDKQILREVKTSYGKMSTNALMKHVYTTHNYYAINSLKAKKILNEAEYKKVMSARPTTNSIVLYTIGYEGISLEEYLNRLVKNDVKVLIDVRRNPLSMKYGFSKSQLSTFCQNLNIQYVHIPEVGIESGLRQDLGSQESYDKLFKIYCEKNLNRTITQQRQILSLLIEKKRVALTCFESNICQCHRKHLAEAIVRLPEWKYDLKHI